MATGITEAQKNALTKDIMTEDGFNNFFAKLGLQTDNVASKGKYTIGNLLSRDRATLEAMYRTSWIIGQVVDTVAEDMTKEGISITSVASPDRIKKMQAAITKLGIMQSLCSTIKWSRLYGGAIAVILVDGADYSKPFDPSRVGKNQFKGLLVLDRWQLEPSFNEVIKEVCPQMGMPKYYRVLSGMETMPGENIHYSRCIRFDGIEMPYQQKKYDNLWGMSIVERLYDRVLAFDSSTTGAAQLMYKAYLRTVRIKGLRAALAAGGKVEQAVIKQFQYIRLMQSLEGMTLLDGEDNFDTHQYSFGGVADVLREFGQQLSGAANIPLVRLFGQSPSGFSTGDTDLRNYYDGIGKNQENKMRLPMQSILETMSYSLFQEPLTEDFEFTFNPLWDLNETEKSAISNQDSNNVNTAFQSGLITKKMGLKELAQNSRTTGRWTNITKKDIDEAKEDLPEHAGLLTGGKPEEKVVASPDHKLPIQSLKEKLSKLKSKFVAKKETPEEDDLPLIIKKPIPEDELEKLAKEVEEIGEFSLEILEEELKALPSQSMENIEKSLEEFLSKEKTVEELEQDLIDSGLQSPSIEFLIMELSKLSPVLPKMPATGRGNSFEMAVKDFFGIKEEKPKPKQRKIPSPKMEKKTTDQSVLDELENEVMSISIGKKYNKK